MIAKEYEQKLVRVVRKLSPERVSQVIDFAQFLESQMNRTHDNSQLDQDESEEEIMAENNQWDVLIATDESQNLIEMMADEAVAGIQIGDARPMAFTMDGEIVPG